jgi:hypothetical protein
MDGLVLGKEAIQLVVVRPSHHLASRDVIPRMHLGDLLGCERLLVYVPALVIIHRMIS